ncbi:Carnitine O-palmitoyltransferase 1,brain isoform [Trichinella pseudospiralis]
MPDPLMDKRILKWNDKVPDSNRPSKTLALSSSNKLPANIESRIFREATRHCEQRSTLNQIGHAPQSSRAGGSQLHGPNSPMHID